MKIYLTTLLAMIISLAGIAQNTDPAKMGFITSDINNFWVAFEAAKPGFDSKPFQELYINKGSKGLKGFMNGRIRNADNMAKIVGYFPEYYASIRPSTERISTLKGEVINSLVKLKTIYPEAVYPDVYFVIGALSSGGTTSKDGLIIGAEMYGLTESSPIDNMNDWLKTVLKPVDLIPFIVAHELIHFQQNYKGKNTLLKASIKEGSADFIAELISGKHINEHVHTYANPKEEELWLEFKERMNDKELDGWLYSSSGDRPNDLGYWIGYKISKSYYDKMDDKKQAVYDILNIKDFNEFLVQSGYSNSFE